MKSDKKPFYVICDNVRSLENIGSIFRTADVFGIDKIYLTGICGQPPHPKISKTALGAEKWILWEHYWQIWRIIEKLKKEKVNIIALEKIPFTAAQVKKSIDINKFKPKFPLALVIGNEVKGVSKSVLKKADQIIHIPMQGKKESLNVAVAFGVAAYVINIKRSLCPNILNLKF